MRDITAPVGDWCDGVTQITFTPSGTRSTRNPSSSTGTATNRAPAARSAARSGGISRILDRNACFSRCHEKACEQIERLLCARGDDDIVRAAHDSARERHVPGDRFAQSRYARGLGRM